MLIKERLRRKAYKTAVYCTTFCNQTHRLSNGWPVGHECYVLNRDLLRLEFHEGAEAVLDRMAETGEKFHAGEAVKPRRQIVRFYQVIDSRGRMLDEFGSRSEARDYVTVCKAAYGTDHEYEIKATED